MRAARCTWQRGEGSEGSEGGEGGEGSEGSEGGEGGTFRSSGRNRTSAVAGWQQPAPSCSSCEFVTRAMYMYPCHCVLVTHWHLSPTLCSARRPS